mgnify:CR=1 FL=1
MVSPFFLHMDKNISEILFLLGENHDEWNNAVAPPIYQTSNFCFPDVSSFRNAFRQEKEKPLYTRGVNPTTSLLRQKLAALEGTEDALVLSSGAAAIAAAVINKVKQGDHVLCVQHPYSWTNTLLTKHLARFGVSHTFADACDTAHFLSHVQPETKVIYLESPNSITFELQDLKTIAAFAKEKGIVTICDNSYASTLGQSPAALGIDIVVHSATKYLNGHSDTVAGVICASKENIQSILGSEFLTLGAICSPMEAWLILRGMRTLQLRVERSSSTAHTIFQWLKTRSEIEKIYFPHDPKNKQYDLARSQMHFSGGLLSVCLKASSIQQMEKFSNTLEYFRMAVSWGGYESLQLPVCTFYHNENERHHLPWNMVRFYFGLEDADVLIRDLENAFSQWKS